MTIREMKYSGLEWVGVVPNHWQLYPIYFSFNERKSPNRKGEERNLLSLSYGKIIRKDINTCEGLLPNSFNSYNIIQSGDIVFRLTDLQNDKRSLRTGLNHEKGIITSAYVTIYPKSNLDTRYYHYLFNAYDICKVFYNLGNGVRQSLNYKEFSRLMVLEPPKNEQFAIANFLDNKCAEIDALTTDIEKQIEILKGYKKSLITEAVTKGLDPNVEMKESGIEWMAKVPSHWKTTRLKNEVLNLDYLREPISADKRKNELGLYDYYGASGVIDKIDDFNVNDTVLLIGEDGANLLMRNLPLIYKASGKFWVNNHAHILKVPQKNDYEYFAFLLEAVDYTNFITGSAQPKLSQRNLNNVPLVIPGIVEQRLISEYLCERCADIDIAVEEKQKQLEILSKYKQSLIYEVVTGKKEIE